MDGHLNQAFRGGALLRLDWRNLPDLPELQILFDRQNAIIDILIVRRAAWLDLPPDMVEGARMRILARMKPVGGIQ